MIKLRNVWGKILLATASAIAATTLSLPTTAGEVVSVELVLSVDVSGSIDSNEFNLQHQGYINAFKDADVIAAIENLPDGLAVTMQYWADDQAPAISWYKITDANSAAAFADAIANATRPSKESTNTINGGKLGGGTNIAGAVAAATDLILNNNYQGTSKVIDVSGDGIADDTPITQSDIDYLQNYIESNNLGISNYLTGLNECKYGHINNVQEEAQEVAIEHVVCPPIRTARDAAVAEGIVINGLSILPNYNDTEKYDTQTKIDNSRKRREDEVDKYYEYNVIGGDGAFIQTANDFAGFGEAVKQKIIKEISQSETPIVYAD